MPGMLFSLTEEGWAWMDKEEGTLATMNVNLCFVLTSAGDVVEAITYVVVPGQQNRPAGPADRSSHRRGQGGFRAVQLTNWTFENCSRKFRE